jgi:hypothetical protein
MKRGLVSLVSALVILLLRKELGIAVALLVAAAASAGGHLVAGLPSKGARAAPVAVGLFYLLHFVFGGPVWSPHALAWAFYMSATFVLPEREAERQRVTALALPGSFGSPSVFLTSGAVAAWVGVFAVPLDWDVEWQVFPVASSILCACVSVVVGLLEETLLMPRFQHTMNEALTFHEDLGGDD